MNLSSYDRYNIIIQMCMISSRMTRHVILRQYCTVSYIYCTIYCTISYIIQYTCTVRPDDYDCHVEFLELNDWSCMMSLMKHFNPSFDISRVDTV